MTNAIQKTEAGAIMTAETASTVLAARGKAEVEARYIMAMQRPRDWLNVRQRMLAACERPGFAGLDKKKGEHGQAWWSKPVGQSSIEGFSIRFAEEALRNMGNMDARSSVVWEDENKRIVEVTVLDLENNISIPTTIVVEKTIERSFLKDGEIAISTRLNSYGNPVYLRAATEDEVLQKQNSAISKAMRNAIMRLLPGDIQAECRKRIIDIRHGDIAKDPAGFQKKIADGFSKHGVKPSDIKEYLGHDLASCTQAELADLRDMWQLMDEGQLTWSMIINAKNDAGEEDATVKSPLENLKTKLKKEEPSKPTEIVDPESGEVTEEFSPIVELQLLAKSMYGAKATDALEHQCKQAGFNFDKITVNQASIMIDALTVKRESVKNNVK